MKPDNRSILIDLDNTVYDMTGSWEGSVYKVYPGIQCDYHPITERLIKDSVLQGCASLRRIYDSGFFLEEAVYPSALQTLRRMHCGGHDVWFVTYALGLYHASLSEYEKRAQLLRDFGCRGSRVVFSGRKWEVPGRFLVDDHPMLSRDQHRGSWEGITVRQVYNVSDPCEKWVESSDFERLLSYIE